MPRQRPVKAFSSKQAALRFIFAHHLEEHGGMPHEQRPGVWIAIYRHPPTQEMAVVNEDGTATILEDW